MGEGGGQLRNGDAREDSWTHLVLITEWKTDDCSEQGGEEGWSVDLLGYLGGYTVWRALSAPRLPPSHHCIAPFLPSRIDFSNSLLPEERTKGRRRQQRRECSPLSSFLSLSVIPSNLPNPSLGAIFHHSLPSVYYPLQNTSH